MNCSGTKASPGHLKRPPGKTRKSRKSLEKLWRLFINNPYHPLLGTHKLSGKLKGHHAFILGYDCRVVVKFIEKGKVALISIGKNEEVY